MHACIFHNHFIAACSHSLPSPHQAASAHGRWRRIKNNAVGEAKTRCRKCGLGKRGHTCTCCEVCGKPDDVEKMLLCGTGIEGCSRGFHIYCLTPPLDAIPDGDWFCPDCSAAGGAAATAASRSTSEAAARPDSAALPRAPYAELILEAIDGTGGGQAEIVAHCAANPRWRSEGTDKEVHKTLSLKQVLRSEANKTGVRPSLRPSRSLLRRTPF